MKDTDLAIMDAIDAVGKVDKRFSKDEQDTRDMGEEEFVSRDYEHGKLEVIKWTLRSLLS